MSVLTFLDTFAAVVESGSFTAAADALGISKPVVSKQISQLEQYLGVQLLHRTTRRLHLTEAGEVFAQYAQNIVAESREAEQAVVPMQDEPQGTLRISASESLAMTKLPAALLEFQNLYPKIDLEVRISGRFIDLIEEGIDVALRVGKLEDSSLIARLLMPCSFHVCAAPDYWERHGIPIHPVELKKHNCLVYSQSPKSDSWIFREKNGEGVSIKVKGDLRSDAGAILLKAALEGKGVLIGPTYMVGEAVRSGHLVQVLMEYARPQTGLFALYPQSKLVSSKVRAFVDYLVNSWDSNTQSVL